MSARTVLLTGATGFLGGAIAAELLEQYPDVRLLFLVRARDKDTELQRVRRSIARFEPGARTLPRVSDDMMLCGGLETFPKLAGDSRLSEVTHVLNPAAVVSFAWKREVWATNVEHTEAFAGCIAALPAVRRVVHVSTAMVSGETRDRIVREDELPGSVRQLTLYTKSKAEIERRLPGVLNGTSVVARPSVIVGHSRLGCTPSASIFWLFRMIHAARRVPFPPRRRIDIVPVDYCARALVHLLLKDKLAHSCYHVSAGTDASCSFAEIEQSYSGAHGLADTQGLQEFAVEDLPAMERDFASWFGECDTKRASGAIRVYRAFAELNVTFDNTRLLGEGMEAPPRFCDYIGACVRTGERESIAEQMLGDFR